MIIGLIQHFVSQLQNPEISNNPDNFHPCSSAYSVEAGKTTPFSLILESVYWLLLLAISIMNIHARLHPLWLIIKIKVH